MIAVLRENRPFKIAGTLLACTFLCSAQEGTPVGGNWVRSQRINKNGDESVLFSVPADQADSGRHPFITVACTGSGKALSAVYNPDSKLVGEFHDPLNFYAPAIYAKVKVEGEKIFRATWDLQRDSTSAFLDRKTSKHLFSSPRLRVLFHAYLEQEFVDEFALAGIDLGQVKKACGTKLIQDGIGPPSLQ